VGKPLKEVKIMSNDGIVKIHGKDYMTVAQRVKLWLDDNKANNEGYSIETGILATDNGHVVIKAIVKFRNRTFTGISSVDLSSSKMIEKSNPYEVAETSAVGRALGFAGYGIIEGIASADEMVKAGATNPVETSVTCSTCGKPAEEKRGISKVGNKPYHAIFCSSKDKTHTQWINDQIVKEEIPEVDINDTPDW